jgi:hypothetical protein
MKLILKGQALLAHSGLANTHQLSLRARISAQTAYKYIENSEEVKAVDCATLLAILIDGLGLTPDQVLDLRVGDLFEIK